MSGKKVTIKPGVLADLKGQWIGPYSGSNKGTLRIELDDMEDHFAGRVYAFDTNQSWPITYAYLQTPNKVRTQKLTVNLLVIHPTTWEAVTWDKVASLYPDGLTFPTKAEIEIEFGPSGLSTKWVTDLGTNGEAILPRSNSGQPSKLEPLKGINNWNNFKDYVNKLDHRRFIFRGQKRPYRLRTSFHRTGRADLSRYISEDIPTLHRHLTQRTAHIFNLANPDQTGAFYNLVQHHGYPTPLLDWTFSPFVGAFFAYSGIRNSEARAARRNDKIRIFIFDQKKWRQEVIQLQKVVGPMHFSVMEFIAMENERLIPQQSISSLTNIDDIETYISNRETDDRKYLQAVDLPFSERPRVMRELSMMGITAGSLFPGLDGACAELRERMFDE